MYLKPTLFFFFIFYIGGQQASGQLASSPLFEVDGRFIKPYTNQWKTTRVDSNGKKTLVYKLWTDYGQVIELDGVKYFHRVQDLYNASGQIVDSWTNLVEHRTLLPKMTQRISPTGRFMHVVFSPDKIQGRIPKAPQGIESTTVNIALRQPLYDWTLYGMLLVGLPLKPQAQYTLPCINLFTGKEIQLEATVKNKETVVGAKGKKLKAWRVETNQNMVFWLSKKAPYVIRLEYTVGSAVLVWEML
ncbi:MAG TPA: hypothetical protein DCS93_25180 [Microscillaceae bacterium]|nr:hypothetical protein [Microscillaceae bacterium]